MRLSILYSEDKQLNFLNNLCNVCEVCDYCTHCRTASLNFSDSLYGVFQLSPRLPVFIEDPQEYLPELPQCDVVVALNIHPDLLLGLPHTFPDQVKALIAPADAPGWVRPGLRGQLQELLDDVGVEYAFCKPFCALNTDEDHPFINQVISQLRIGTPQIDIEVKNDRILRATCKRSAPCGSTYYVCEKLKNVPVDKVVETISEAHHAFPCNAAMVEDSELKDTPLHKAGYIVREAVLKALEKEGVQIRV